MATKSVVLELEEYDRVLARLRVLDGMISKFKQGQEELARRIADLEASAPLVAPKPLLTLVCGEGVESDGR